MCSDLLDFPLQPDQAKELLRQAVKDSKLTMAIPYRPEQSWYKVVSFLQVVKCIEKGRIASKITQDDLGNLLVTVQRLCGGSNVQVHTAIKLAEDQSLAQVYVVGIENRVQL